MAGQDYSICGVQADGGVVCWGWLLDTPAPRRARRVLSPAVPRRLLDGSHGPRDERFLEGELVAKRQDVKARALSGGVSNESVFSYARYSWRNVHARASLKIESGTGGGLTIWYGNGVGYYVGLYPAEKEGAAVRSRVP